MDIIPQETRFKQCAGPCKQFLPVTTEFFHHQKGKYLHPWCKTCRNAKKKEIHARPEEKAKASKRTKAYHEANKEHLNTRAKEYHESHKEQSKAYHEAHRQERIEYNKAWHQANKEHEAEYHRTYYDAHAEGYRAYSRAISKANPIKGRLAMHIRRSRQKAVPGKLTHQQIQEKVCKQKYCCYYCSAKFEKKDGKYIFHIEHTIPISRTEAEPRHDINYVVLACPTCNNKKHNKLPHEWFEGGRLM